MFAAIDAACAQFDEIGRKSYLSRWLSHPRVFGSCGEMIVIDPSNRGKQSILEILHWGTYFFWRAMGTQEGLWLILFKWLFQSLFLSLSQHFILSSVLFDEFVFLPSVRVCAPPAPCRSLGSCLLVFGAKRDDTARANGCTDTLAQRMMTNPFPRAWADSLWGSTVCNEY